MSSVAGSSEGQHRLRKRAPRGMMFLSLLLLIALMAGTVTYVSYVLWPRWPAAAENPDTHDLPIVIGQVTFNIPPRAIRVPVQRHAGAQERVDLAFMWPSLTPPGPEKIVPPGPDPAPRPIDRLFVTISADAGELSPVERLRNIYPRYVSKSPDPAPPGLISLAFQKGSPYQGEDLIYDFENPERFFVRCTRPGAGDTPGTCLAEQRIKEADMIVRFPRDWLADWHGLRDGVARLLDSLRPKPE